MDFLFFFTFFLLQGKPLLSEGLARIKNILNYTESS